jgi:hypothetical protein
MPILCQKAHSKMGLKTTPKGLNMNSPRWNLGFHRRYKNGMINSNQKKLPVNTLGTAPIFIAFPIEIHKNHFLKPDRF